jgi:DNA helicase INO80
LKIVDVSPSEASTSFYGNVVDRWSVAADIRKRASRRVLRSADVAANEHLDAYRASLHSTRALDPTPTLTALEHVSTDLALDTLVCISQCYYPRVVAAPIEFVCSDRSFAYEQEDLMLATPLMSKIRTIAGTGAYVYRSEELLIDEAPHITTDTHLMRGNSPIHVPPLSRLVLDSGKLARLDKLLAELKAGGHRVLIYFQMTRMIDLMEEYLAYRRYTYLRLDGSSKIEDRRDMVTDWQTK